MNEEKYPLKEDYKSSLTIYEDELAIVEIKMFFQKALSNVLNLKRATAPLFLDADTGLNDNLSGKERPVGFSIKEHPESHLEVVQSLAKWKRYALGQYSFHMHEGLYCDMNAIRRDEELDNLHSIYVDQWDWEKIISKNDRNTNYLEKCVRQIYSSIRACEEHVYGLYPYIGKILPKEITFIDSEKLLSLYPDKEPKERERLFAKEHGAIFIERIGGCLSNGKKHDERAPDYDDWSLNGDILVYYPLLDVALELSSMGIRVDSESLKRQLDESHTSERAELPFQKAIIENKLPLTIGGGIGQSRLCMFMLRKAHIGEVQSSYWDEENVEYAKMHNITLL